MAELDYAKLGFKSGIEIHQQLEGKKLFCSCQTVIRKDEPDFTITRKLRASAGETGEVDQAALHEQKKDKYFIYQGYEDTTCLVEADCEPPHEINKEALKTALQVAMMLKCKIVDQIQVMRKTVVDGSNTSGFKRTALVGRNGYLELKGKKIGVPSVCLEEEACQVVERNNDYDVYNLSRLGIPLIEIATDPDMITPEEVKEVAAKIGMILRSTGACKRGIGSIRQDVNLSIKGGARTEVKGFQEYKNIPEVIEKEVERQLELINAGKKVEQSVRKAEPDFTTSYLRPMPGADRMYPETDIETIIPDIKNIKIPKLLEEKSGELEEKGLGKDLADKLVKEDKLELFTALHEKFSNIKPAFIAEILVSYEKELERNYKGTDSRRVDDQHLEQIFSSLNKEEISKSAVLQLIVDVASGRKLEIEKYKMVGDQLALEQDIKSIILKNPDATIGALMGMIMAKHQGKVDGRRVMEIVQRYKK